VFIRENSPIELESVEDIIRCTTLSSLLELSGYPKPGNIHRTQDYKETRYEHFLAGVAALQPVFSDFCNRIYKSTKIGKRSQNFSYINLGKFFRAATQEMMRWQKGGNIMLGHILILGPLAASAVISLRLGITTLEKYKEILNDVITDATVSDTIQLYDAIRISNPGGLGKVKKYDLTEENSINELKRDRITLKQIFEFSQNYDLISKEYATGFHIILNEGFPYFIKIFAKVRDINIATVHTFLKILSNHPDTLIIRKSGMKSAEMISEKSSKILNAGGLLTEEGKHLLNDLDGQLQEKEGKLNPGTTADLIAGVIFMALLFGLRF
jgi:triphosphoribosyl-dephospho-CoA synthase